MKYNKRCALVGGHTAEASELSLGFAVNGVASVDQVLRKGGMEVGEVIIITKAVGTGTLFAAEMKGKARGPWVATAIDSMCMSNRKAALCLRDFHASSCTDVTGFGVLGHLVEMVNAQDHVAEDEVAAKKGSSERTTARLYLGSLPCLDGAIECIESGIFSSLQPQNVRLRRAVRTVSQKECSSSSMYPLLFDPQTAGGLLATVPVGEAHACVDALIALGYTETCMVGEIISEGDQPENDRGVEIMMSKYEDGRGEKEEEEESSGNKSSSMRRRDVERRDE